MDLREFEDEAKINSSRLLQRWRDYKEPICQVQHQILSHIFKIKKERKSDQK